MKKAFIYNMLLLVFIFQSCEDCECIDPITQPISCDTGLLIMRSDGETGEPRFSLDSISKPLILPLNFQNIIQNQQDDSQFDVLQRPSNYDAYNKINNTYFIEFPLQQRLYKYDINTQSRQELIIAGFYAAPIFNNGTLYAISIENNGYATNPVNYSIQTINQTNGTLTNLVSSSFALTSSFDWESMSSATDSDGNVYFVSGTNFIKYNLNTNVVQHIQLTPNFDLIDNFERYYGLELRNNGNLIAIRERDGVNGEGHELVELNSNNLTSTPTVLYDFMANGIDINSEFYSTSYDPCDDKYYVTTLNNDFTTSDFYELDLIDSTVKSENFSFYMMGIQSKFK